MREQLTAAVRSRLAGDGGPYGLLEPAALTEAAELFACTTDPQDVPETCHLVGLLHWHRGVALADERAEREARTAVALLYVVHESRSGLSLPEPLERSFLRNSAPGDAAAHARETAWERLLVALEPWLQSGADPHSLRLAVSAGRNAVSGTRRGHPRRAQHLAFLGAALQSLFEHTGDMAALAEAVEVGRAASAEALADGPDKPMYLSNLASTLLAVFERTGDAEVLREAVAIGRSALRSTPEGHSQRYVPLSGLSLTLWKLYECTDDAALLDEAARMGAAALDAMPDERAVSPTLLTNHGSVLHAQFECTGSQAILNEAITVARRAADTAPPRTPLQWRCLYNLATLLEAQFERTGDLPALNEAIEASLAVVRATPADRPDAPLYQSTLVAQLKERFSRTGDSAALDEAISWGHNAVEGTPQDHPNRAMYLANLAVALKAKADHTGDLRTLRQAIDIERLAADSVVDAGPQARLLTNLGNSLRLYFEHTGETMVLDNAIAAGRAAVAATFEDHPDKSLYEINLALSLSTRGLAIGDEQLVDEAIGLLETAASRGNARLAARVDAAQEWGRLAMLAGQAERAARGFAAGVELLPRLAARGLVRADATHWLARYSELASDAAACVLNAGQPDRAVELLEMGRGVLLGQALESRTDLTELRERDAGLADRFTSLCAQLDAQGALSDAPDRRRELAEELAALVSHIRTLTGLDRFLLSPEAAQLAAEAHAGPIAVINVSRYRCDALILTPGGVQVQELPSLEASAVRDRLAAMRGALSGMRSSKSARQQAEQVMHETLAWLWDTVTGPVLQRLGITGPLESDSQRRIWWVPCGPLACFPLHAAGHHLEESARDRDRRTVMDRAVSSYTPTVRALAHARARQTLRVAQGGPRSPRVLAVAMPHTPGASDLPGVLREFEQLTKLLPTVEGLIGKEATRDAVLSRLPANTWAHFACHADSDPADPSNSHLLVHDHAHRPLSVLEISRLRLEEPEFAYLSACSTAVTSPVLADESIHAVTAFQLAGYPHVVGTLWEIDDAVASQIAEQVYTDLASNGSDAGRSWACVYQAIRLIRDRYPRIPTLWAAHIHTGA